MNRIFNLSEPTQNILLMAAGAVLLLHAFGIFACALSTLVIIVGAALFLTGFIRGGYWDKIKSLVRKK